MSLKRKASLPSIASPQSAQSAISRPFMDDSPKHLHCRTRKRVRNDRPDDQTVYENTIRWLFSAQQQVQQIPNPPADQDEDMEPETPAPVVDHGQQTLLQFFRPAQSPRQPCPSNPISQFSSAALQGGNEFPQGHDMGSVSPSDSGTMTPAPQLVDCDGSMDMDLGGDGSSHNPSQWTGALGCM
ncbi:hypothetical protein BDW62DRAFT_193869 [Aspergillus aurantiobrunneus]